jgi:hypothetical protein
MVNYALRQSMHGREVDGSVDIAFLVVAGILITGGFVVMVMSSRRSARRSTAWTLAGVFGVLMLICGAFCGVGTLRALMIGEPFTDAEIRTGRLCTATVLSFSETHVGDSRNTEVLDFRVRVQPVDGSAYETTVRDEVNHVEAGRVGAGIGTTGFRCVIDREDNSRVHIFWLDNPSPSPSGE